MSELALFNNFISNTDRVTFYNYDLPAHRLSTIDMSCLA